MDKFKESLSSIGVLALLIGIPIGIGFLGSSFVNDKSDYNTESQMESDENDDRCDSNYSGACVPIASDVDCASGTGNGPEYVDGPVYVEGYDVYGLDGDGDGVGCE